MAVVSLVAWRVWKPASGKQEGLWCLVAGWRIVAPFSCVTSASMGTFGLTFALALEHLPTPRTRWNRLEHKMCQNRVKTCRSGFLVESLKFYKNPLFSGLFSLLPL